MSANKTIIVFISACLLVFSLPLHVYADRCDDVMDEANQLFDAARGASKQKDYDEAIDLYEEAESYYQKASKMKNCRCPKIKRAATYRVSHCRDYADKDRRALESLEKHSEESYDQSGDYVTSCGNKSLVTVQDENGYIVDSYCE